MRNHLEVGRWGEALAVCILQQQGYQLLERNWRAKSYRESGLQGEIDAVFFSPEGELVFLEVKTRSREHNGHPLEAIGTAKVRQLRKLAYAWCASNPHFANSALRIDSASVCGNPAGFSWEHRRAVA